MLGRAAPITSHWPERRAVTMSSGLVNRPLLTTGTLAPTMDFTCETNGRIQLVLRKRELPASSPHSS